MTLREYFAAAALQGYCANDYFLQVAFTHESRTGTIVSETLATSAVEVADAMMKKLNEGEQSND